MAAATSGDARWSALDAIPPVEVSRRTGAELVEGEGYRLELLGRPYRVAPARVAITGSEPSGEVDTEIEVVLLGYLAHAVETPFTGKWISPSSLPGGDLFFRGPHVLPVEAVIRRFGGDAAALRRAGQALGAVPLAFGDVSIALSPLPRILLAVVLWAGDEEFPARSGFLFDSSMDGRYPLDMVLALTNVVVRGLVAAAG